MLCCAQACGVCHELEDFYRGAHGGGDKDEL
jgi:hypothetical protein